MAEIRSTLDMVMERANRMAARAEDVNPELAIEERGMRLVVEFMNGKHQSLSALLAQEDPAEQMAMRRGMGKGLLRNIVLPRDETQMENCTAAINAFQELAGQDAEIATVCGELGQILEQYSGHVEQVKQQLADGIRTQIAQQLQQQTGEAVDINAIDPTMHPQYQKEWERAKSDLNDQYNQAVTQRKEMLSQRLT